MENFFFLLSRTSIIVIFTFILMDFFSSHPSMSKYIFATSILLLLHFILLFDFIFLFSSFYLFIMSFHLFLLLIISFYLLPLLIMSSHLLLLINSFHLLFLIFSMKVQHVINEKMDVRKGKLWKMVNAARSVAAAYKGR